MNVAPKEKIVLLGFLSHFPVAGVAWQTIHYLVGFQRLGYDVYYVEAHGCTPSKLMQSESDDGALRAAAYIGDIMRQFDLDGRWAYHAIYESRCFGMRESELRELYRSAALLINLHGSHLPLEELTASNRLVYLGTDPVDIEIDVHQGKREALDYLAPHCAFFTYGENLGRPDCQVPEPEPFQFRPTRQPVVMDLWEDHGRGDATTFTTIGNWRQPWREVRFKGEVYRWSKHLEFQKFIDVPGRTRQPFELALSSYTQEDQRLLESKGWRVRRALDLSENLEIYRRYIGGSRGEFTVAKDQNVRLRSGWFSDRAATYLAAGRPVITQETGFSNILPTGRGLFAFSTVDDIVQAVESINRDYDQHRRAAQQIAREYLSHEIVLAQLLGDLGFSRRPGQRRQTAGFQLLPSGLVLAPIGRWPTRLPEETLRTALNLPVPFVSGRERASARRATIVIVTHNGLPYTKMCLASLLTNGWHQGDELIIVDNASTDGTDDFLRSLTDRNPWVCTVFNDRNRGFAVANNQGLARAAGEVLILLNNDTIVLEGWSDGLVRWLEDPGIGAVGPVTNRTCNEAQIDSPYRTYGELEHFVREQDRQHRGRGDDIPMLAMFCLAMRREVFKQVGPLDERFEVGMFEDDDYAHRLRQAGYRLVCAEDVFVHHFGQASLGELCTTGDYDRILEANRGRFEQKWGVTWKPHGRRITPEYRELRRRIGEAVARHLPAGATVAVVSKGDNELLNLGLCRGWHFPQLENGEYANLYPEGSAEATSHLEALRARGAGFLLIPKPALWWLDHYGGFKDHLERHYPLAVRDPDTCCIFDLRGANVS
jgi:GT2 family glycosyltransferase